MVLVVACRAVAGRLEAQSALAPLIVCGALLLQVVPLPDRVLVSISPLAAGAWKVASEGLNGAEGCVAVDPGATLVGCRRMLIGLASIVALADMFRRPSSCRIVRGSLAVSGVLILALGVLFPVEAKEKVLLGFVDLKGPLEFWRSPVPAPVQTAGWAYLDWATAGDRKYLMDLALVGDGFGSYISSNEFAAGVYITFPAALAAVAVATKGRIPVAACRIGLAAAGASALWVVGGMAKSRAGCASLFLGGMIFFTLLAERPRTRRAWGIATIVAAIALVGFVLLFHGYLDALTGWWPDNWRSRLVALRSDGRVIASHAAMRMFFASPMLGIGLDSYSGVYPRMTGGNQIWYFAHNDYAQLLAETGLVGLSLLLGAAGLAAVSYSRFLAIQPPGDRLEGAAAWAGLAALAVHSAFDWNLHVPANAFLACVLAGQALASGIPAAPISSPAAPRVGGFVGRVPGVALAAACVLVLPFLARDAASDVAALNVRKALAADQIMTKDSEQASALPLLQAAVAAGGRAAARDRSNAQLAALLGQANLRLASHAGVQGPDRAAYESAADRWFRTAKHHSATVRGLPEPAPDPSRRPL